MELQTVTPIKLKTLYRSLSLVIITALLAFSLAVPARVEESAEQQWEYLIQSVPDLQFTDMMTLYGRDGWELVFARRAVIARSARERLQARSAGRDLEGAHSRFPGHALTPTGVMAIRCKQFHLPDL